MGQTNNSLGLNKQSKGGFGPKPFLHNSAGMVEIRLCTENQLISWGEKQCMKKKVWDGPIQTSSVSKFSISWCGCVILLSVNEG